MSNNNSSNSNIPLSKRSVLVSGVSAKVGPDTLKDFFKNIGDVTSVNTLNYDPISNTRQYQVTFSSPDSILSATQLTGAVLLDKVIKVVPSDPADAQRTLNPNPNSQPTTSPSSSSTGSAHPQVVEMPSLQQTGISSAMMHNMLSGGVIVPDNNAIEFIDGHRVAVLLAPGSIVVEKKNSVQNFAEDPGKRDAAAGAAATTVNPDAALIAEKHAQVAKTVYIGNIQRDVSAEQLSAFLSGCGMVTHICFRGDELGGPVRYGFVEFDSVEAAHKAMSISGSMLEGYPIKVNLAKNPIVRPSLSVAEVQKRKEGKEKLGLVIESINARIFGGSTNKQPVKSEKEEKEKEEEEEEVKEVQPNEEFIKIKKENDEDKEEEKKMEKDDVISEKEEKEKEVNEVKKDRRRERSRSRSKSRKSRHRHHHHHHHRHRHNRSRSSSRSNSPSNGSRSRSRSPEHHKSKYKK